MDHYEDIFKALEAGKADVGITGDQAALYELEHGGSSRLSLSGTILRKTILRLPFPKIILS